MTLLWGKLKAVQLNILFVASLGRAQLMTLSLGEFKAVQLNILFVLSFGRGQAHDACLRGNQNPNK